MSLNLFLHLLSVLWGNNPLSAARPPSPCAAVGYTSLTSETDFTIGALWSFDSETTYKPRFGWYRWNWFGVRPDKTFARVGRDGLVVHERGGGFSGHVASAARSGTNDKFVGTAFGGGACVEIVLRFDPDRQRHGSGHPSFWSMSYEHLANEGGDQWPGREAGYARFVEWDIFEYYKVPEPGFLSSWITWFGFYIPKALQAVTSQRCTRPYCKVSGSFGEINAALLEPLNWRKWQSIIGVWVPASGKRPGHIQTFLNQKPIGQPKYWNMGRGRPDSAQTDDGFSTIDQHHQVFIISSGDAPLHVKSVRVWQRSGASNLTR